MIKELKSYKKLTEAAKNPVDLSDSKILTPQRIKKMLISSLGYTLFYATERLDEKAVELLFNLANETNAVKKMADMQKGEIVNNYLKCKGENRPALHTAARDFFENKNTSEKAQKASALAYQELLKLEVFLNKLNEEKKFQNMRQKL